jgi:hypothetical protein
MTGHDRDDGPESTLVQKSMVLDRLDILNKHKSATVDAINLTKKENEEKCRLLSEARTLRLLSSFPL